MNAGTNRRRAILQAHANAQTDKKPRYVHRYQGVYWVESQPLKSTTYASDVIVVYPNGTWESYNPMQYEKEDNNRVNGA